MMRTSPPNCTPSEEETSEDTLLHWSTFNKTFSIHIVWLFFLLQELDGPNVSRAGKKLTLDPVEWKRLNQLYSISFFDVDTMGTAVDCWKAIDSYLCNRKMAEQACTN